MKMKVSNLLTDESKWCQHAYARDVVSEQVNALSNLAASWCIVGAAARCGYNIDEYHDLTDKMLRETKMEIAQWQDRSERTFSMVRELLLRMGH